MYQPLNSLSKLIRCAISNETNITRRDFQIAIIEACVLALAGRYAFTSFFQKEISANKLLQDFPTSIPQAASVEKYPNAEAKYCLVHILQAHAGALDNSQEDKDKTICVQKDIYSILEHLIENFSLGEVYQESSVVEQPHRGKQRRQQKFDDASLFEYGAVARLEDEGKIKAVPAESYELVMQALFSLTGDDAQRKKTIFVDRENFLLELISKQQNPLACTVYGGLHNWLDNIEEWNKKHPDKKFSLIVVKPEAYKKMFE